MSINLKKIIESGWTNFRRNGYLSFGATGIMALALILFLGLLTVQFLTSQVVATLQEKIDISAYFKLDATEEQVLKIKSDVAVLPEVDSVVYVSRDQALEDFKSRHVDDKLIQESLAQLELNPLAASINIRARDASQYASIAKFLEDGPLSAVIDKISFYENRGVVERIESISNGVKSWGLGAIMLLGLIAVLVTFNTVRLTIYNQKQEIEIMRLVGASNWHVRGPYLTEGGLYGLFASVMALGVFYPSVYLVSDKVNSFIPTVNLFNYYLINLPQVVLMVASLGIALGVISSSIAIKKHLKI
ncbi:MAG: permease-like cell division protein FtsX [Patescibacteria group bacterium]